MVDERRQGMRDDTYKRRAGRNWFSGLLWMMSGGMLLVAFLLGWGSGQWSDRLLGFLGPLFNVAPSTPKVNVQSLILQQVRDASELTTASFTMQAVIPAEQDATFNGLTLGKTKLLYIAYGEVQAGVNLSQLTTDHVQVTGDSIQVQLPAAQILDKKIDVNRSQVYDYDRGFLGLGPDSGPQLQALAQQEALRKITAAACEQGLLQRASDRAQLVVTQLLNTTGYKNVSINIQPASTQECAIATAAEAPNSTSTIDLSAGGINPTSSNLANPGHTSGYSTNHSSGNRPTDSNLTGGNPITGTPTNHPIGSANPVGNTHNFENSVPTGLTPNDSGELRTHP
jgi:hypothetical protein